MLNDKTIVGLATESNNSSISVIRISGDESLDVIKKIFIGVNNRKVDDIKPFTLRYGFINDGDSNIDDVLVSYFKSPKSYTGEDVIEISCHGGALPSRKILELILKEGIRLAEPGEFTKRAFLNGRIDLSQAEAVMDIISSRTENALKAANDQSRGKLGKKIFSLREILLNTMAKIEVTLDFPDDDLERSTDIGIQNDLKKVKDEIDDLLVNAETGKLIREGIKVVIAGKPNVGKSSLLNVLLNENRAIVTDIPGTTRDVIEEVINLDGIPVRIVDTAGIRNTDDTVEKIGVEKSIESIDNSDLVILVLDGSNKLSEEDIKILEKTKDLKKLVLINKVDLDVVLDKNELAKYNIGSIVEISAKDNFGIDAMKEKLKEVFKLDMQGINDILVSNTRHKDALIKSKNSLIDAINAIDNKIPLDLVSIDVNDSWSSLGEINGDTLREDLVDKIFTGFCIGK